MIFCYLRASEFSDRLTNTATRQFTVAKPDDEAWAQITALILFLLVENGWWQTTGLSKIFIPVSYCTRRLHDQVVVIILTTFTKLFRDHSQWTKAKMKVSFILPSPIWMLSFTKKPYMLMISLSRLQSLNVNETLKSFDLHCCQFSGRDILSHYVSFFSSKH